MTATYIVEQILVDILGVIQSFEVELHRIHRENGEQCVSTRRWACDFIADLINASESRQPPEVAYARHVNLLKVRGLVDTQAIYLIMYALIELRESIKAVAPDVELGVTKHVDYNVHGPYDLLIIVREPLP